MDQLNDDHVYFSPGVECPGGFTAAVSGYVPGAFPSLKNSETGIICCPSPMSYDQNDRECQVRISSAEAVVCAGTALAVTTGATALGLTGNHWAVASALQLRFQVTDVSTPTSSAGSTGSASKGLPPDNTGTPESKGLPTGAKAGIGVGVPIAVVGIVMALLYWRRRRSSRTPAVHEEQKQDYVKPELDGTPAVKPLHELPTGGKSPAHELPATQAPNRVYELPE